MSVTPKPRSVARLGQTVGALGQHRGSRRLLLFTLLIIVSTLLSAVDRRTLSAAGGRLTRANAWLSRSAFSFAPISVASEPYIHATPVAALDAYAEHPIHLLMREAQATWSRKIATQSRSISQAEDEYRRRYKMDPPPHFDKWVKFCLYRKVQLLDEYDGIMDDILPFLSLPGAEVLKRTRKLGNNTEGEHFLLRVKNGKLLDFEGASWRMPIRDIWRNIITELLEYLPDMELAIEMHDGPKTFLSWEMREAYEQAAREKRVVDEKALVVQDDGLRTIRERHCPPDSAIRRFRDGFEFETPHLGPAFVANHEKAISYCHDPHILPLNGATSNEGWITEQLTPSWTMSRMRRINGDVLWPPRILYELNPPDEKPFLNKTGNRLVWRGSPDGISYVPWTEWRRSHRFRLIRLATSNDTSHTITIRATRQDRSGREYQVDVPTSLGELNERYSNVRATAPIHQGEDYFYNLINRDWTHEDQKTSLEEMAENRYVFDVDGNAYSARFRTHLESYQVPLKATVWNEWFEGRIVPWLHYVPVRQDYSDLYNILAFFDGGLDADRTGHHDDLAERIANAGREWATQFWRHEDMQISCELCLSGRESSIRNDWQVQQSCECDLDDIIVPT